jgi:5-methylcytosine-specific restriction endonuclease McrA
MMDRQTVVFALIALGIVFLAKAFWPSRRRHVVPLDERDGTRVAPRAMWFAVMDRDGWECQSCGRNLKRPGSRRFWRARPEADHWPVPWSKGGTTTLDNLRATCRRCNERQSNRAQHYHPRPIRFLWALAYMPLYRLLTVLFAVSFAISYAINR